MSQPRQDPEPHQAAAGGPRIAIVGAGPAGLSAAWFLKKRGYKNVTVFERHGRVGGLCFSMNDGYKAYDLGGNYITPAYRETRKIARAVGARTYRCHPYIGLRLSGEPGFEKSRYIEMTDVVREVRDEHGEPTSIADWTTMALAALRYVIARWKVRKVIDRPDFAEVHNDKKLCVSFDQWLQDNRIEVLRSLFEIPITMMGYGFLDEIAAPYALKYLPLRTFIPMCLRQVWFVGWMFPWPRRFELGFQRMWEAVSWQLNVRNDVVIKDIWRHGDPEPVEGDVPTADHPIRIDLNYPERIFHRDKRVSFTRWFDYLIVGSSRVGSFDTPQKDGDKPKENFGIRERDADKPWECFDILQQDADDPETKVRVLHLDPKGPEARLFAKVKTYGFCMTTFHAEPADGPPEAPFRLKQRVVCVLPFRKDATHDRPWVVVQLWPDESQMLQCYTRLLESDATGNRRKDVLAGAERMVKLLDGRRAGAKDPRRSRWEHYEQWPYFGHVGPDDFGAGFFHDLETKVQGRNKTFWVGGFTNFELIEPIVCYAKAIVEKNFPSRTDSRGA